MYWIILQVLGPLVSPLEHCFVGTYGYVKRKCGYVTNLKENLEKLNRQEQDLIAREADVKQHISANLGREKTNVCSRWLSDVQEKKQVIESLRRRHDDIKKSCCGLSSCKDRAKLGKEILTEITKTLELRNAIADEEIIAAYIPDQFVRRPTYLIDDYPSLNKHVERIQELLKDDDFNKIRIWGLPGVGKTTVLENLHNGVGESNQFEIIFWVTMKETRFVEGIQQVLEERLGLKVDEQCSTETRRARISSELQKKSSYLLLLDQVSSKIDLNITLTEVGVEIGMHAKVVFACRSKSSNNGFISDEDIHIKTLSNEDALNMFMKIVKDDVKRDNVINGLISSVVGECGGVLQLIKVIASQLAKTKDPAVWRVTLAKLRSPKEGRSETWDIYYQFFELAYNDLKEPAAKVCILYWEVFPAGRKLPRDYVIECWRTEEFFTEGETFFQTRDKGHVLLEEYVDNCLLETGRGIEARHYKMFKPFQEVAARMAKQKRGKGNGDQSFVNGDDQDWRQAERVSLICCRQLSGLPDTPQCSGIRTLLLQENHSLVRIPETFFTCMVNLYLLDLHDTEISSLPSSISSLKRLRSLYLNRCRKLDGLPSEIGELQSLEILDLSGTGIINGLLSEIHKLTNLKCLRVSVEQDVGSDNHTQFQPMAEVNNISKLTLLEELSISVSQDNKKWNDTVDTIVKQAAGLKELTTLCFYFPKVDCLDVFTRTSQSWNREDEHGVNTLGSGFRTFYIAVGNQRSWFPADIDTSECSEEKHLTFAAGEVIADAVLKVLEQTRSFELIGHQSVISLSEFGADALGGLEICKIEDCSKMETIIDGDLVPNVVFRSLKKLCIIRIPTLEHIWKGSMNYQSLSVLTTLILKHCPRLKHLFSWESGMVLNFPQLQHLELDDCVEMKEIIETRGDVDDAGELPKLEIIKLLNLPNLDSICGDAKMKWPSLTKIEIKSCGTPKGFLSALEKAVKLEICKVEECNNMESIIIGGDGVAFQCLKKLQISAIPTLEHIWEGSMNPGSLSMLTTLILKDCPRLYSLFSSASGMVLHLGKLQHLKVDNCLEMKQIIESGRTVEPRALPELKSLELRNLPKLLSICGTISMEWPSLELIVIEMCEMLKDLPSTMENASKLGKIRCTKSWWDQQTPSKDEKRQRGFQRVASWAGA